MGRHSPERGGGRGGVGGRVCSPPLRSSPLPRARAGHDVPPPPYEWPLPSPSPPASSRQGTRVPRARGPSWSTAPPHPPPRTPRPRPGRGHAPVTGIIAAVVVTHPVLSRQQTHRRRGGDGCWRGGVVQGRGEAGPVSAGHLLPPPPRPAGWRLRGWPPTNPPPRPPSPVAWPSSSATVSWASRPGSGMMPWRRGRGSFSFIAVPHPARAACLRHRGRRDSTESPAQHTTKDEKCFDRGLVSVRAGHMNTSPGMIPEKLHGGTRPRNVRMYCTRGRSPLAASALRRHARAAALRCARLGAAGRRLRLSL